MVGPRPGLLLPASAPSPLKALFITAAQTRVAPSQSHLAWFHPVPPGPTWSRLVPPGPTWSLAGGAASSGMPMLLARAPCNNPPHAPTAELHGRCRQLQHHAHRRHRGPLPKLPRQGHERAPAGALGLPPLPVPCPASRFPLPSPARLNLPTHVVHCATSAPPAAAANRALAPPRRRLRPPVSLNPQTFQTTTINPKLAHAGAGLLPAPSSVAAAAAGNAAAASKHHQRRPGLLRHPCRHNTELSR